MLANDLLIPFTDAHEARLGSVMGSVSLRCITVKLILFGRLVSTGIRTHTGWNYNRQILHGGSDFYPLCKPYTSSFPLIIMVKTRVNHVQKSDLFLKLLPNIPNSHPVSLCAHKTKRPLQPITYVHYSVSTVHSSYERHCNTNSR